MPEKYINKSCSSPSKVMYDFLIFTFLTFFLMGLEIVPGPNQWAMALELPGKQRQREN